MIYLDSKEKLLIMGDFNFADLKWGKPELLDHNHLLVYSVLMTTLLFIVYSVLKIAPGVKMFWI